MFNIFVCLSIFTINACFHFIIHKILARFKVYSIKTVSVFFFGLLFNLYWSLQIASGKLFMSQDLPYWLVASLPLSSLLLYCLLCLVYTIFYTAPLTDNHSPSTRIIPLVEKRGKISEEEIIVFFSNKDLITGRLSNLEKAGLIGKKQNSYKVLKRGKILIGLVSVYRRLLNWHPGG